MTVSIQPETAYLYMLVFARIGTMAMIFPVLGERGINMRARLVISLLLTLVIAPLMADAAPVLSPTLAGMMVALIREILIGAAIGIVVRLLMSAIQVSSNVIAFQMGLGFALNVDPTQGIQGAIIANFLTVLATTLILATDTHHLLIGALWDSYTLFPAGQTPPVADFAAMALETAATAFRVAIQLAAPFLVFGLIFNLGMGIISRLIPQIQVFFVSMPISIMLGFLILSAVLVVMMDQFLDHFRTGLMPFAAG
ncbi:MAG: flagellar biosynthetic protein FliR [Pseudomonadota bacterium]